MGMVLFWRLIALITKGVVIEWEIEGKVSYINNRTDISEDMKSS